MKAWLDPTKDSEEFARKLAVYAMYSNEGELIAKTVLQRANPSPSMSFLDIGCGTGEITAMVGKHFGDVLAIDINPYCVRRTIERGVPAIHADWETVDLRGRRFDVVLASHILYYFPRHKWEDVLRKMLNHLKPNGKLFIAVNSTGHQLAELLKRFGPHEDTTILSDHVSAYLKKIGIDNIIQHDLFGKLVIPYRMMFEFLDLFLFANENYYEEIKPHLEKNLSQFEVEPGLLELTTGAALLEARKV